MVPMSNPPAPVQALANYSPASQGMSQRFNIPMGGGNNGPMSANPTYDGRFDSQQPAPYAGGRPTPPTGGRFSMPQPAFNAARAALANYLTQAHNYAAQQAAAQNAYAQQAAQFQAKQAAGGMLVPPPQPGMSVGPGSAANAMGVTPQAAAPGGVNIAGQQFDSNGNPVNPQPAAAGGQPVGASAAPQPMPGMSVSPSNMPSAATPQVQALAAYGGGGNDPRAYANPNARMF